MTRTISLATALLIALSSLAFAGPSSNGADPRPTSTIVQATNRLPAHPETDTGTKANRAGGESQ